VRRLLGWVASLVDLLGLLYIWLLVDATDGW
jgi:hypothetical protein